MDAHLLGAILTMIYFLTIFTRKGERVFHLVLSMIFLSLSCINEYLAVNSGENK